MWFAVTYCRQEEAERIDWHPPMRREDGVAMNQMAALVRDEYIPTAKKIPLPRKEERAAAFSLKETEFGLLDIVFLDAIVNKDAPKR